MKKILLFLTVISSLADITFNQYIKDLKKDSIKSVQQTEQWVKDGILSFEKKDMPDIASTIRDNIIQDKGFFKKAWDKLWDNIKFKFGFESVKGNILNNINEFRQDSYQKLSDFKTRLSRFDNSYDYKSQKDSIKEFFGDVSKYGNLLPPDKEFKDKCLDLLARSGYRPDDNLQSDQLGKFLFGHDDYDVSEFKQKVKEWAKEKDIQSIKDTGTTKYGDNSGKMPGERGYDDGGGNTTPIDHDFSVLKLRE